MTPNFDKETNTNYNYYRDYNPEIGRYLQSDPIGLTGGINQYALVLNNPLSYSDPFGLDVNVCFYTDAAGGLGHVGFGIGKGSTTSGFYPTGNPFGSLGVIKEDVQGGKQCKVIPSNADQDQCMLKCRAERATNPGEYSLTSRQCTAYVRDCLKECSVPAGEFVGNAPWPFYRQLPGNK